MRRVLGWVGVAVALGFPVGLCALLFGLRSFSSLVRRDVEALLAQAARTREGVVVTEEMLQDLPEPVRRYLRYTGIVGKPFVNMVRLKQKGRMHPSAKGAWIPLEAEEYYSVRPPGFVWDATMHWGPSQ